MVSVSPLRLAGAVAVLPPIQGRPLQPPTRRLQSSRAVQMRGLAELQRAAALHSHPDVVYGAMIPDPDYSDDDLRRVAPPPSHPSTGGDTQPPASPISSMVARNNRVNASNSDEDAPSNPRTSGDVPNSPRTTHGDSLSSPRTHGDVPSSPRASGGSPLLPHKVGDKRFDENGFVLPKKIVNPSHDSTEKKSLHRELLFNQKAGVNVLGQKTELQKAMEKHKDKQAAKEQQNKKQANLTPFQRVLEQQAAKIEQSTEAASGESKDQEPEGTHEFQKLQAKIRGKQDTQ